MAAPLAPSARAAFVGNEGLLSTDEPTGEIIRLIPKAAGALTGPCKVVQAVAQLVGPVQVQRLEHDIPESMQWLPATTLRKQELSVTPAVIGVPFLLRHKSMPYDDPTTMTTVNSLFVNDDTCNDYGNAAKDHDAAAAASPDRALGDFWQTRMTNALGELLLRTSDPSVALAALMYVFELGAAVLDMDLLANNAPFVWLVALGAQECMLHGDGADDTAFNMLHTRMEGIVSGEAVEGAGGSEDTGCCMAAAY